MSIIVNGVELTEVIYAGVNLDIVKVKKGAAEAVTVFEKITQLATPQNVTANGTTVSWDAVENATSYEVLADGARIGTVSTGYKVTFQEGDYSQPDYYSTDNGVTWISCHEKFGTGTQFIVMAKQIKLKVEGVGSYGGSMWATSDSTGASINELSVYCSYNTSQVSPNYVLTENITVTASGFSD